MRLLRGEALELLSKELLAKNKEERGKDHVDIPLISERRLMIATGDIPGEIKDRVAGTGEEITQDFKYDLE